MRRYLQHRLYLSLVLVLTSLLLISCGGSGDGTSTPTPPPAIALNGDNPVQLALDEAYVEAGAIATDANDAPLEVSITGAVSTDITGEYTLTYEATDADGNSVSTTRRVFVGDDNVAPSIALIGPAPLILPVATEYVDQGAQITDNRDTLDDITVVTNDDIDITQAGEYTFTYLATDRSGNAMQVDRTVVVVAANFIEDASGFITTWDTANTNFSSSADNQIRIPTTGSGYDYSVNWGDGGSDLNVTGNITHTYSQPGLYRVVIRGDFPRIFFNDDGDRNKLLAINQWGTNPWLSMQSAFAGCTNLMGYAPDTPDLSQVTNMAFMFGAAFDFNQDLSNWDVSSVTNMAEMFYDTDFNQDLSSWDVSSVTTMSGMFEEATAFNQDISNWDVSSVTRMAGMFFDARAFNQDISNWDVSAVTNMVDMFFNATAFNQDLSNWDVSAVRNMSFMFFNATAFNQDLSNWDVSSVRNMSFMFRDTRDFNQDLSNWDVSSVTTMRRMFQDAGAFNQDLSNWNVSSVTDMGFMFENASAFNQDISGWDVSAVTTMRRMFQDAGAFNQDLSNWNVSSVTDMNFMFSGITLSVINYDALLISMSTQALQNNVTFDGGTSQFSAAAQAARDSLLNDFSWTVIDGGLAP